MSKPNYFIENDQIDWGQNASYPDWLKQCYRYCEIAGPGNKLIEATSLRLGMVENQPGSTYPEHFHSAAEIYIVLSGTADWTVNGISKRVTPGQFIFHPPEAIHKWHNCGDEVLKLVWIWFGSPEDLSGQAKLID